MGKFWGEEGLEKNGALAHNAAIAVKRETVPRIFENIYCCASQVDVGYTTNFRFIHARIADGFQCGHTEQHIELPGNGL